LSVEGVCHGDGLNIAHKEGYICDQEKKWEGKERKGKIKKEKGW